MSETTRLNAQLAAQGQFNLGPAPSPANTLAVTIQNAGDELRQTPPTLQCLYLDMLLGADGQALFNSESDARRASVKVPEGWNFKWNFQTPAIARLQLSTTNAIFLAKGQTLPVEIGNVISKTAPGIAKITLRNSFDMAELALTLDKAVTKPDVIYFLSDPEEGTPNLPDSEVKLHWLTAKLTDVALYQTGSANPLDCVTKVKDTASNTLEGTKSIFCGGADETYRLEGYDGSKKIERSLSVKALRNGWQAGKANALQEGSPGSPGELGPSEKYPLILQPTLFFNANDQALYGIFQHRSKTGRRALLFQTQNPFGHWAFVQTLVQDKPGAIPPGHGESPGVYADDALWLLGGSQIDPDHVSNAVWRLGALHKNKIWTCQSPAAPWPARMGHGVLAFDGAVWVMGGRDVDGNALNDVWKMDLRTRSWQKVGDAPWAGRCLFGAAVFNNWIWLYGGAAEPFAATLFKDLWVYGKEGWREKKVGVFDQKVSADPLAAGLQAFKNKLLLVGKFRAQSSTDNSEAIEARAFALEDENMNTWARFPDDGLGDWGAATTFGIQLVNFKGRMLLANALAYGQEGPDLQIYVSASQ